MKYSLKIFALISLFWTAHAQAETTIRTAYETTFLGLPLSRSFITTHLDGSHYRIEAKGRTSALVAIINPIRGSVDVAGELTPFRAQPESFKLRATSGSDTYEIALAYNGNAIASESVAPKREPKPDLVPVTEAMKQDVIDPLSAFLMPLGGKQPQSVCERRVPIYTGRERFDLVFSPNRSENVAIAGLYKGPAVVCSARYVPLGGHRSEKFEVKYMIENKDIEAWFVPLTGSDLMGLYKIHIGTRFGPLEVEVDKAQISLQKAERP